MRVFVLGADGMLGHMVTKMLSLSPGFDVKGFGRDVLDFSPMQLNMLGSKLSRVCGFNGDYIINCVGASKPTFDSSSDVSVPLYVNAILPHQIATWGELTNTKVIHISSDCVYDGKTGQYYESDGHNARDLYGKSKSIGEPNNCMVLRTSIIGPEINGKKKSLLEWVKSQNGKTIKGFANHYWNGLTTIELAYMISDIIVNELHCNDLFHIFSDDISKYFLLKLIVDNYQLDINVEEHETDEPCDRTLRSEKTLNEVLVPGGIDTIIRELANYELTGRL